MQDLFQALKMLQDGVQQFAVGRVINDANDQVRQIHETEMDHRTKIQNLRNLSNQLTMRLSGMGANPTQVEQAAGAVAPPKAPLIQSTIQGLVSDLDMSDPGQAAVGRERLQKHEDSQNQMKLLLAARKFEAGAADKKNKLRDDYLKEFGKVPGMKDLLEGFTKAEVTPDDLTNPAAFVAAQRGYIKASGDNKISNEDLEGANVDKSLWAGVQTLFTRGATGAETKNKAELMRALLDVARYKSARAIQIRAGAYSRVKSRHLGESPESFHQDIMDHYLGGTANFAPAAAAPRSTTQGTTVIQNPGASTPAAIGTAPAALPAGFRPRGK